MPKSSSIHQCPDLQALRFFSCLILHVSLGPHQYSHTLLGVHVVFLQIEELHHLHFLTLDVFHEEVVLSNGRIPLGILFVSNFNAPFPLPFCIIISNLFDGSPISFGLLMWFRRLYIVVASKISYSMSLLSHESRRRWSALMWSFDFNVSLGF